MLGPLRRFRPVRVELLATAMIAALQLGKPGVHTNTFEEIIALASTAG
jgi:hypothetical protein